MQRRKNIWRSIRNGYRALRLIIWNCTCHLKQIVNVIKISFLGTFWITIFYSTRKERQNLSLSNNTKDFPSGFHLKLFTWKLTAGTSMASHPKDFSHRQRRPLEQQKASWSGIKGFHLTVLICSVCWMIAICLHWAMSHIQSVRGCESNMNYDSK